MIKTRVVDELEGVGGSPPGPAARRLVLPEAAPARPCQRLGARPPTDHLALPAAWLRTPSLWCTRTGGACACAAGAANPACVPVASAAGWDIRGPVRRIWIGERSLAVLTEGKDAGSREAIKTILFHAVQYDRKHGRKTLRPGQTV